MFQNQQQKQYFFLTLGAIIVLIAVVLWPHPNLTLKPNQPANQQPAFDYNAYLASLQVDPAASKLLLQNLVSEEDVKAQVREQLGVGQPVVAPVIDKTKLHIVSASGKDAVGAYFTQVGQQILDFNGQADSASSELFVAGQSTSNLDKGIEANQTLVNNLYDAKVPKEALAFHQAALSVYQAYLQTMQLAKQYNQNASSTPWPGVYQNYSVINDNIATLTAQLKQLDKKYQLADLPVFSHLAKQPWYEPDKAQAVFGAGDTTIVIGNIPDAILQAVKEGLSSAFANFATQFLNNLITAIEKNYKIANFLYYTDALVQGEYVNDYLDKYINDPLDRAMITNFIPQFTCGNPKDVKKVLQAKADQYLGFDPNTLSPTDPDYYTKMARVGDFLSSSQGWQVYYDGVAQEAESKAQQAANQELLSNGLKSPRDALGTEIAQSLASIDGSMKAAFNAQLNLGVFNASQTISAIVTNITYNLFNKFVFQGAVVFKEQKTCVPVPQLQPVIPAANAAYATPSPIDTQAIYDYQCSQIRGGCPSPTPTPTE